MLVNHLIKDRLVGHIVSRDILGRIIAGEFASQRRERQSEQATDIEIEVCVVNDCNLGVFDGDVGDGNVFPAEFARYNARAVADVEVHILDLTTREIATELGADVAVALL